MKKMPLIAKILMKIFKGKIKHPVKKVKISKEEKELEEMGIFSKRLKSHHDAISILSNHFRNKKDMLNEKKVFEILSNKANEKRCAIYVHIPYCDKICSFCNLNRTQLDNDLEDYTNFLLNEIEKFGKTNYMKSKEIEVIFFGGGTPTILKEHQLEKILEGLHKNYNISKMCEFTFETTLHNLPLSKVKILEKYGVNRLSVGIQTFNENGRKTLNRTFSKKETISRLKTLKENFNGLVCIDIIYNYPNQSEEDVLEDAKIVIDLEIDSVSFYSLMIHEGSKMSKDIKENSIKLDYQLEKDRKLHNIFLNTLLDTEDYEILEHTKIVKKGRDKYNYIRCTHQGIDLLPLGIGAGGKVANIEMFRLNDKMAFYAYSNDEIENKLKKIGGLFQYPEIKFVELKKYISEEIFKQLFEIFKNYEKKGYLKIEVEGIKFTREGIFWGNNIDSVILRKCMEFMGGKNEKIDNLLHINGKHGENS